MAELLAAGQTGQAPPCETASPPARRGRASPGRRPVRLRAASAPRWRWSPRRTKRRSWQRFLPAEPGPGRPQGAAHFTRSSRPGRTCATSIRPREARQMESLQSASFGVTTPQPIEQSVSNSAWGVRQAVVEVLVGRAQPAPQPRPSRATQEAESERPPGRPSDEQVARSSTAARHAPATTRSGLPKRSASISSA